MSEGKLPKGWRRGAIPDLISKEGVFSDGDWVESKDQDPDGDVRLIQLADIGDGTFKDKSQRFLTSEKASQLRCTFLKEGDILLARMPDPLGRACIFPFSGKYVTVVDVAIIRPSCNPKWLMYWINTPQIRGEIFKNASGSTRLRISRKNLSSIKFPIPSIPEQQRIVARLDALFGRLDVLKVKLDRIPELLKNFRQQVLTQAVTGDLTKEWREGKDLGEWEQNLKTFLKEREIDFANSLKIKNNKIRKPEYLNYPITDLKKSNVKGWFKGPIGLICDSIVPGRDKPKSFSGEIPWVTMPILKHQFINKKDAELFLSEEEIQSAKAKVIPEGSVIMSIVGRFGIGSILKCDAVINQQLHAFLPCPILSPKFLLFQVLTSEKYLSDISTSTTVAYINKKNANSLPVSIPPIEEQEEIVKRVDALFYLADKIESQYQSLKAKIDQLPQAILAKAFRGELVGEEVKKYVREVGELGMVAEGIELYKSK